MRRRFTRKHQAISQFIITAVTRLQSGDAPPELDAVVNGTFDISRVAGSQMEPRSGIGADDVENDQYVITAGKQGVHRYRDMIASALRVENQRVRVICPDVGGGFGPRGRVNPEFVVLAWAAHRLGRPAKWTNTRSGSFISYWQGRDMVLEGELDIMRDGGGGNRYRPAGLPCAKPHPARLDALHDRDRVDLRRVGFRSGPSKGYGIVRVARLRRPSCRSADTRSSAGNQYRPVHQILHRRAVRDGTAAAEVEIDPETGEMTLCNFCIVNDSGVAVNPMIVHGQVHGGIVQGVGQPMGENVVYETFSGRILTGSILDYMMPRANQFPVFRFGEIDVSPGTPEDSNLLGIKAGGEAGTVPALAILGNAVLDALSPLGIQQMDMPFTAANIWHAINEAKIADT